MTCLNVLEHAEARYGGIAVTVPALARALAESGRYRSRNAAFCVPAERTGERTDRFPASRLGWLSDRGSRDNFRWLVSASDLVHVHGLWRQHASAAVSAARRFRKPYLVSAHGMLERWALGNKAWKKALYAALVERGHLQGAACLRALTRQEVSDYRRFGVKLPVAVVPNGVDLPPVASPEPFFEAWPELRGARVTLFLGRVHYKKGPDVLCRAWARARRDSSDRLAIAGPDFEGTRARLEQLVAELGIAGQVTFTGLVDGAMKSSALAAASVFALPSHSEGLSTAVLEALAAGVPVVASPGCNLPEIVESDCGWVVAAQESAVAGALAEALSLSAGERERLAENGRRLIARRFSWPTVAAQMAAVYDWVLGGARPVSVEVFS